MISQNEIDTLKNQFDKRGSSFFHTCHLSDLKSYLEIGGIPSKALLEKRSLPFIDYHFDVLLKKYNLWNKIRLSMADDSQIFFKKGEYTPNPFGSILFQISNRFLEHVQTIEIFNPPTYDPNFDPEKYSITKPEQLEKLFEYPIDTPLPERYVVKTLYKDYPQSPEILFQFENDFLPFSYVTLVLIEPYWIFRKHLHYWVSDLSAQYHVKFPILRRYCPFPISIDILREIITMFNEKVPSIEDIMQHPNKDIADWGLYIKNNRLSAWFEWYVDYFYKGTYLPIKNSISNPQIAVDEHTIEKKSVDDISEKQALEILKKLIKQDQSVKQKVKELIANDIS